MGWDTTTEMTAMVVDSLTVLIRLFRNANYEPDKSPIHQMLRPYEVAAAPISPPTISGPEFLNMLKE